MMAQELAQLLPAVFRRGLASGTPLQSLLEVMEGLHAPAEDRLTNLDRYFDPWRCPESFLPTLAAWLDLGIPVSTGTGRWRALIAAAVDLYRWRGTKRGLQTFFEIATGKKGFVIQEMPFHIRIHAPLATRVHAPMLRAIIELEKPAHVTHELVFEESDG